MGSDRARLAEERALHYLRMLRCPAVRRAEGMPEWEQKKGAFIYTPDLVAGQLIGDGDPRDFYIDVIRPTGDWYVKPGADHSVAHMVRPPVGGKVKVNLSTLKDGHANYVAPLNGKLDKYSKPREWTTMVGLVMYVSVESSDGRSPFVYLDSMAALDRTFRLSHHAGVREREIEASLLDDRESLAIFAIPFDYRLAFFLWIVEREGRAPKLMLIINAGVIHDDFEWRDHAVVKWLRRMAETPQKMLLAQLNSS